MTAPVILTALEPGETPWYYINGVKATYMGMLTQLNNNTDQTTGVLANYGTASLLETFALFSTTENMHQYVQSVAMTGVDPSEIGSANDIVTINNTANGFVGINQNTFLDTTTYLSIIKQSEITTRFIESMYFY